MWKPKPEVMKAVFIWKPEKLNQLGRGMLISICIPHYNRAKYLLKVLESIKAQHYRLIEVIISDDCSKDDSATVIPEYISSISSSSHVRFRYLRQKRNIGYDANLRASLAAASGDYLFILGNDDALPKINTLSIVVKILESLGKPDVAFGNYYPFENPNQVVRRALSTAIIGSGPDVARKAYRSFSFVGGIIMRREVFHQHNTDKYDGSIYVQMYLASRIIAAGGTLATIQDAIVEKDIMIGDERANSYIDVLKWNNSSITPKTGGLDQVGRVVCDAILPYVDSPRQSAFLASIYIQLFRYSYAFWLYQYRKDGVFRAAVNLAFGCLPARLLRYRPVGWLTRLRIFLVYVPVTFAGLVLPLRLLDAIKQRLYLGSKKIDSTSI